ncbi:MAG: bifunctional hydroxymethylpyrimidine kinase/phosphomethylpyrimidine kinase [Candidatus Lokiarchaeota archaeon]|nr:bifunctional hydroxymethylpyrimidine kinase/phosphomethylpyrimidine kinase [Candidatus Lokiarchaeota archaeon]
MKYFCLTIAGADPTSSAGIQADIRTFDRCGIHSFSVITAITNQTATEFFSYKSLSDTLESQLNAILKHYPVRHVKVGMIPDIESLDIIAEYIQKYNLIVVYDPVTISSAGKRLSLEGIEPHIEQKLLPLVKILTPNLSEASKYSGINLLEIKFSDTLILRKACDTLLNKMYAGSRKINQEKAVIVKNALSTRETVMDFSVVNRMTEKGFEKQYKKWEKPMIKFKGNVHGTGCVFSSAITAYLSLDNDIEESLCLAEKFFDEKFSKFIELPEGGKVLDLTVSEERRKVINQVKEVYDYISKEKRFVKLIPEVRLNISCSLPNAKSKIDIAGIEGRVTIINGFPQACGDIKFGVTDHTARLILAAKEFDNSINLVINLKYKNKYVASIQENTNLFTYEFVRESQPDEIRDKENSTMQWLIKKSVERTGKVPDIIWDKGAVGKEPIIRVFAKNSGDLILKLNTIISTIM